MEKGRGGGVGVRWTQSASTFFITNITKSPKTNTGSKDAVTTCLKHPISAVHKYHSLVDSVWLRFCPQLRCLGYLGPPTSPTPTPTGPTPNGLGAIYWWPHIPTGYPHRTTVFSNLPAKYHCFTLVVGSGSPNGYHKKNMTIEIASFLPTFLLLNTSHDRLPNGAYDQT